MSKRIVWLDQLRGIAMFAVVLGHVALPKNIISLIYSFHMPLFFMISGMTMNDRRIQQTPMLAIIEDKAKKLIIPYLWMAFMLFPLWYLTFKVVGNSSSTIFQTFKGILYGNNLKFYDGTSDTMWFLLALFFANLIYAIIVKLAKDDESKFIIMIVLCAVIGNLEKEYDQIWHFNVGFTAVVFLYIGRCIMKLYREKQQWFDDRKNASKYFLILVLTVVGWYTHKWNGRISMHANNPGKSVLLFYITAMAFSFAAILVIILLPKLPLMGYIGKNTLLYVGVHMPVIKILRKIIPEAFSTSWRCVLSATAIYLGMIVICAVFNRVFPYVCAKAPEKNDLLTKAGKVFLVFCCGLIPVLALYEKTGLSFSPTVNWAIVSAVTVVFSIIFCVASEKFFPFIYFQEKRQLTKK